MAYQIFRKWFSQRAKKINFNIPQKHELKISREQEMLIVHLKIQLSDTVSCRKEDEKPVVTNPQQINQRYMLTNNKIRCLIIDDEPLAREILKQHIAGVEALELAGTCSNAVEAISFLKEHPVDLLFLDIQMPQLLGTNFIRTLKNAPKVIFTTAFREICSRRI